MVSGTLSTPPHPRQFRRACTESKFFEKFLDLILVSFFLVTWLITAFGHKVASVLSLINAFVAFQIQPILSSWLHNFFLAVSDLSLALLRSFHSDSKWK